MLESIGLSRQDESVYEALVRRVHATVAELAHDCRLPTPATRRSVRSLVSSASPYAPPGAPSPTRRSPRTARWRPYCATGNGR